MTRIASSHPGDLARHLRRQPRRDRHRARRVPRRADARARDGRERRPRPPARACCERARAARRNLPDGHPRRRRSWSSCASRSPTARASLAEVHDARRPSWASTSPTSRSRTPRGTQRCARAVVVATDADALRGRRSSSTGTTPLGRALAVSGPNDASRSPGPRPLRGSCASPATRASRTARCCSRRWPTGDTASTGLAAGDDVARTRRAARRAGVDDHRGGIGRVTVDRARRRALREPTRRPRLRQLGHHDADARRASSPAARSSRCSPATRRSAADRWRAGRRAAARDGCARSTVATAARARRSTIRGGALAGCAHALDGRERAGEDRARARRPPGRRHHRDHRAARRAATTPSGCSARSARRSTRRRPHGPRHRGRPAPFELERARRPVVGRVLGRRGARHPGFRPRDRGRAAAIPDAHRVRRRAPADGRRRSTVDVTGEQLGEPVGEHLGAHQRRSTARPIVGARGDHRRAPGARGRRRVRRRRHRDPRRRPSCG